MICHPTLESFAKDADSEIKPRHYLFYAATTNLVDHCTPQAGGVEMDLASIKLKTPFYGPMNMFSAPLNNIKC